MELHSSAHMERWLRTTLEAGLGMKLDLVHEGIGGLGEGPAITIGGIVTIESCEVAMPSILGQRRIAGYSVSVGDDERYRGPFIGDALLAVVDALARLAIWQAKDHAHAEQLRMERDDPDNG